MIAWIIFRAIVMALVFALSSGGVMVLFIKGVK